MPPRASGGVQVRGLRELQRELRNISRDLPTELKDANRAVADFVVEQTRRGNLTPQQAKAINGVLSLAQQRYALVGFDPRREPFVRGAFFGAKQYPQFPPWVGNQWEPGAGGGPYVVGEAIRSNTAEIIELFGELIDELVARHFP